MGGNKFDKVALQREAREAHAHAGEQRAVAETKKVTEVENKPGPTLEQRAVEIKRLGLKPGIGVVVQTTAGLQEGRVDTIDAETARVWVRGIDKNTRVSDPDQPVLCSPFAILEVFDADRRLEK